jgi:type I restriction enzyme M protein
MLKPKNKNQQPLTTAQQLSSIIKSARDIMRKDKGLNGDLDRLPMLTWIMFLKFLDDLEQLREEESKLEGKRFKQAIEKPYRWRDWAAKEDGITGDELISFINNEEALRPDGKKGPGLFAYLRSLQSANGDRRDVIATVFKGTLNRMINGYLLRDVVNKLNSIHFNSSDEIHTLSHLYESLLKEMRDSAGDSGEFYTPRAVVRFMVEVLDPKLGEIVLDPACGTGGFLVESFIHLEKQCRKVEDRKILQTQSIVGGEAKSLPYLLAQMNLLLHGLEYPRIDPGNSLRFRLAEIGDKDRVDVIMTNPPFGGEEERGILNNFPDDKQTAETALLFLQLIMRKLKRVPKPGRAGVVVPDGILAGDGICARIKEELIENFNVHTIVRLPEGTFSPYTGIPTNLIFFERGGPTKLIWFYEHQLPADRKNYTKTMPLKYEEFTPLLKWWKKRSENDYVWKVNADDIRSNGYNLDIKNPKSKSEEISVNLIEKRKYFVNNISKTSIETISFLENEKWNVINGIRFNDFEQVQLGDYLDENKREEIVEPEKIYPMLGISLFGKGPFLRETLTGMEIKANRLSVVRSGDFIYSRLFAWRGAFGVIIPEYDNHYVSNEFPSYRVNSSKIDPEYLRLYFCRPTVWKEVEKKCKGTTKASRNRFKEEFLLAMIISVPELEHQREIVKAFHVIETFGKQFSLLEKESKQLSLDVMAELYRGRL